MILIPISLCLLCLGMHLSASFYMRGDRYICLSLTVFAKITPLGFGLFFFLQCQTTPCNISFQLFFSREIGQRFVRRGKYSRAEGPKHLYEQYYALKPVIPSLLPCHCRISVCLFPVYNMQSPT